MLATSKFRALDRYAGGKCRSELRVVQPRASPIRYRQASIVARRMCSSGRYRSNSSSSGTGRVIETRQYSDGTLSTLSTISESWLFFRSEIVFNRPFMLTQTASFHEVFEKTLQSLDFVFGRSLAGL